MLTLAFKRNFKKIMYFIITYTFLCFSFFSPPLSLSELLGQDFTETYYTEDGKPVTLTNHNYTVSIKKQEGVDA